MPGKPKGERALTVAERQARLRKHRAINAALMRRSLERIQTVTNAQEAQNIATETLQHVNRRLPYNGS